MSERPYKRTRPKEFTGFLLNPHKGCETFQRFEGDALYTPIPGRCHEEGPLDFPERAFEGTPPGSIPSTVSYCRWFWEIFEPEEGRYDFAVIERSLETAASRGQTLHVRLMPFGAPKQPKLPKWYRDKYPTEELNRYDLPYVAPIHDGPEYLAKWGGLITEFGRRFDGDPRLEAVDMSYLGMWGEGQGGCTVEGVERMTEVYLNAHKKTPIVAMIGGAQMKAGVQRGTGWRCDSCDDLGIWGDPEDGPLRWNHLYDLYPREVAEGEAQNAWKTAPVAYEPGGSMTTGFERNFDLDFIIRQDLKYHGSLISFKSRPLPEPWMEKLTKFCNDLGYRFVARQFKFDPKVKRGTAIEWSAWIENVGVAPIYRRYTLAVRATQGNRVAYDHAPDDIRTWLPGDACPEGSLALPAEFASGTVMLHAGLVDPATNKVRVRFSVEGTDSDGWLPLGTVEIT